MRSEKTATARKRLAKHVPNVTLSTNTRPLLGSGFGYHSIAGVASTSLTDTVSKPMKSVIFIRLSRSYERKEICQTERWRGPAAIVNDKVILSSERMLHKDYDNRCLIEKNSGCESQGTCRQEELIGSKPPVVK
jgi:hypothetical protein